MYVSINPAVVTFTITRTTQKIKKFRPRPNNRQGPTNLRRGSTGFCCFIRIRTLAIKCAIQHFSAPFATSVLTPPILGAFSEELLYVAR